MLKLGLQNFQPFEKANFQFDPGITVILGPSSSGKTAVFRAIRDLLLNPGKAKYHMRHNSDETTVAIQWERTPPIFWLRRAETVAYRVGVGDTAQTYSKTGKAKLHSIVTDFPLKVNDRGVCINMHSEWDKLFPFDYSPSDLFKLFEQLFQVSRSVDILDTIKQEETDHKQLRDHNMQKLSSTADKINALDKTVESIDLVKITNYSNTLTTQRQHFSFVQNDLLIAEPLELALLTALPEKRTFDLQAVQQAEMVMADLELVVSAHSYLTTSLPTQLTRSLEVFDSLAVLAQELQIVEQLSVSLATQLSPYQWKSLLFDDHLQLTQDLQQAELLKDGLTISDAELLALASVRTNTLEAQRKLMGQVCPLCGSPNPHYSDTCLK